METALSNYDLAKTEIMQDILLSAALLHNASQDQQVRTDTAPATVTGYESSPTHTQLLCMTSAETLKPEQGPTSICGPHGIPVGTAGSYRCKAAHYGRQQCAAASVPT